MFVLSWKQSYQLLHACWWFPSTTMMVQYLKIACNNHPSNNQSGSSFFTDQNSNRNEQLKSGTAPEALKLSRWVIMHSYLVIDWLAIRGRWSVIFNSFLTIKLVLCKPEIWSKHIFGSYPTQCFLLLISRMYQIWTIQRGSPLSCMIIWCNVS